ncbi:MAG: hypothetical protein HW398_1277, partial [Acidobacteria bacterium]|nr:hypothetical protein [Acidobacteriota bacterium]
MADAAAALPGIWKVFQPLREESVPKRHLDFRQALGVHDIAFLDDFVPEEQESGQRVHLIVG